MGQQSFSSSMGSGKGGSNPSTSGQPQMGMPNQASQNYGGSQPPQLSMGQAGGPSGKGSSFGGKGGSFGAPQQNSWQNQNAQIAQNGGQMTTGMGMDESSAPNPQNPSAMTRSDLISQQRSQGQFSNPAPSSPTPANFQAMLGGGSAPLPTFGGAMPNKPVPDMPASPTNGKGGSPPNNLRSQ